MSFKAVWYCHNSQYFGGGERLILEGQKHFRMLGIDCPVLMSAPSMVEPTARKSGYDPEIIYGSGENETPGSVSAVRNILQYVRVVKRIYREAPDILICNSAYEAFIYSVFRILLLKKKIRYVNFQHGSYFQFPADILKYTFIHRKAFRSIWNEYEEYHFDIPEKRPPVSIKGKIQAEIKAVAFYLGIKGAEALFVLSEGNKKIISELFHHPNILVLHGAFPAELLEREIRTSGNKEKNEIVFFSLCRLVPKKRVDVILKAFALYNKSNPSSKLIIGGTGSDEESLKKMAEDLGAGESVVFAGFIIDEEVNGYYEKCDVFVSADLADYDITTVTALAFGKKLVVPHQHEFNHNYPNVFQSDVSPEAYCDAIALAAGEKVNIDTPDYKQNLLEYSWEFYYKKIAEHLRQIIDKYKNER